MELQEEEEASKQTNISQKINSIFNFLLLLKKLKN